jgi:putative flippase GtrA
MRVRKQVIAYLFAGGIAAAVNFSSRFLLSMWFSYAVAIVLAYGLGMLTGFVLMRWLVFDGARRSAALQAPIYILVNVLAVLQTLAVSLVLARWVIPPLGLGVNPEAPAHLVGIIVPVFTSYFGHKYFTFR